MLHCDWELHTVRLHAAPGVCVALLQVPLVSTAALAILQTAASFVLSYTVAPTIVTAVHNRSLYDTVFGYGTARQPSVPLECGLRPEHSALLSCRPLPLQVLLGLAMVAWPVGLSWAVERRLRRQHAATCREWERRRQRDTQNLTSSCPNTWRAFESSDHGIDSSTREGSSGPPGHDTAIEEEPASRPVTASSPPATRSSTNSTTTTHTLSTIAAVANTSTGPSPTAPYHALTTTSFFCIKASCSGAYYRNNDFVRNGKLPAVWKAASHE